MRVLCIKSERRRHIDGRTTVIVAGQKYNALATITCQCCKQVYFAIEETPVPSYVKIRHPHCKCGETMPPPPAYAWYRENFIPFPDDPKIDVTEVLQLYAPWPAAPVPSDHVPIKARE